MTRPTDTNAVKTHSVPMCHFREMKLQSEDTGAMTLDYNYECSVCGNTKPLHRRDAK